MTPQIPSSLKSQRSHAYSWWDFSFYPGLNFLCFFFQIWQWIKWEVNMWYHNDQRSFWIEKQVILRQFTFYFSGHLSHLCDGFVHDIFPSQRIIHSLPIYSSSHYTLKNSCWFYCCHHHCCHYHQHPEGSLISILHTIYPLL